MAGVLAALLASSPASGQVGVAASIFSDDRFRGYSISDDLPVGILDLSYDAPDGLYGSISGSLLVSRNDGIQPLGLQLNAGYAARMKSGLTVDLGVTQSNYSHYSSRGSRKSYTEGYVGIAGKILSARLSVSPDYLQSHVWTVYGELNGRIPIDSKLRLTGHVGLIVPLRSYVDEQVYHHEFDWRVGIAQDIGRATFSIAWTGVEHGRDIYQEPMRRHSVLVFGVTYAL